MRFAIIALIAFPFLGQRSIPGDRTEAKTKTDKQQKTPAEGYKPPSFPGASNPSRVNEPSPHAGKKDGSTKPEGVWDKVFAPDTWSNWALVIVGTAGTIFGLRTLRALQQQVSANIRSAEAAFIQAEAATHAAELAEKTLFLTERADVLLASMKISSGSRLRPETVISFAFKNYGRTRANQVKVMMRLMHPDLTIDGTPKNLSTVIGAGETIHPSFQALGNHLPGDAYERISMGEIKLRFETEITYMDVFDKPHTTRCGGIFDCTIGAFVYTGENEAN